TTLFRSTKSLLPGLLARTMKTIFYFVLLFPLFKEPFNARLTYQAIWILLFIQLGLVAARLGSKRDSQPVPPVDSNNQHRQGHHLLLIKILADAFVKLIGYLINRNFCQRFGPGQCSTFPFAVERGLTPGIQPVQSLFGFAAG